MIGPKKLSEIRQQLKAAMAEMTDDPIQWLEEHMTSASGATTSGEQGNEVVRSLQRFLEANGNEDKPKPRARRAVSTK